MQNNNNVKNPARWLANVWDRLPEPGNSHTQNIIAGWCKAFGLDFGDGRVFSAIHAVRFMMVRAQNQLQAIDFPAAIKSKHLEWVHAFQNGLKQTATGISWGEVKKEFTAERRVHLSYAVEWLENVAGSDAFTQSDLDELSVSLARLADEISKADLEDSFKKLLLDMVSAMQRALAEYMLTGAAGVETAMGEIAGTFLTHRDVAQANAGSPWWDRVGEYLLKFVQLGANIKDTVEVLGITGKLLGLIK